MAADPIVYCLENLTDYFQFERLCHDLMLVEGYKGLEPLGGWKDKGRDAIHISKSSSNEVTIFAYSVREDWRKKLEEDANKIKNHAHECQSLVLACTAFFSASERDNAVLFIHDTYGWDLHIYGIERIRTILSVNQKILANHPQIFSPPFFSVAGGLSLTFSPEFIIIDFSAPDEVLATWLARKLKLHGYLLWCRSIDPVAGESINDTTESLIKQRAFFYISILSAEAISDPDLAFRRNIAVEIGRSRNAPFLIPILSSRLNTNLLDSHLKNAEKISFIDGWQGGLESLLKSLEAHHCPKTDCGKQFALNSFFPTDVVLNEEEEILSNVFPILQVPETISRYISKEAIKAVDNKELISKWAFRKVNPTTFLGFHPPPNDLQERFMLKEAGGAAWPFVDNIDGIPSDNLAIELIRKSLKVACELRGLFYCSKTRLHYFPQKLLENDRLKFISPDGKKTNIKAIGERKYYRPGNSEIYRYYLSPYFSIKRFADNSFWVVTRIYIRITDENGNLLEGRKIISRRKHLCKDWWNNDWINRIVAIMQFVGNGDNIRIGQIEKKSVSVGINPLSWIVPVSICEKALSESAFYRDYLTDELLESDDK